MKILSRLLSVLAIASLGLAYVGCGGGDDEEAVEKSQLTKLSNVWNISSVTLDGTQRTDFTNLTLTISGAFDSKNPKGPYNYTMGGTRPNPSPWPASGTWSFGSNVLTQLIRHDDASTDQDMTYTLTSTELTISFNYSGVGFAGSRVNQVAGNWVFTFTK
jgi:hypothetical protein